LNYLNLIRINTKEIKKGYRSLFGPPLAGPAKRPSNPWVGGPFATGKTGEGLALAATGGMGGFSVSRRCGVAGNLVGEHAGELGLRF
jgi:hypothetical protein